MKLRIAQIRIVPKKGNLTENFSRLRAVLAGLENHQPDVVVTPECFLDGYVSIEKSVTRKNILKYAIDPESSPYIHEISAWSARCNAWFIFGCTRKTAVGAFNSTLVINRNGKLTGIYDKVHCQRHDRKYLPGNSLPVFNSDFGKFGVMICADRRWPETVRSLALQGARVIFNPTYGMHCDLNLAMMRTRSYESETVIVFTHPKQSLITGVNGQIITDDRRRNASFTITVIDPAETDQARNKKHSHLKDRRPDVYL